MTAPVATLGGEFLSAAPEAPAIGWAIAAGIQPSTRVFELTRSRAERILAVARGQGGGSGQSLNKAGATQSRGGSAGATGTAPSGPLSLEVRIPGKPDLVVSGLYVVGPQPGSSPHTLGIEVADSRWLWKRVLISRSFNLRRRSGERRLLSGSRPETSPVVDDVTYAPWSLRKYTTPWTPAEALRDVMEEVVGPSGYRVPDAVAREVPFEDVEINASGDQAIAQLLAYLPGYGVYVDRAGVAVVYDTRDQSEREVIENLGPAHQQSGWLEVRDLSLVRPARVVVHFEQEPELRFDFTEDTSALSTQIKGREPLDLENVAPSPDFTITVDSKTIRQGQWTVIGDTDQTGTLLKAWDGTQQSAVPPLNQERIRKLYFPGMRNALLLYGHDHSPPDLSGLPDPVWLRRIQTLMQHWRLTYRVLRQWMDNIRSIRAYRVAILDPETGTRAPANAYCDYIVKPTLRTLSKRATQRTDKGWAITGYATNLTDATPAPVDVRIIDEDQGVFALIPRGDPWGEASVFLGKATSAGLPDWNPAKWYRVTDAAAVVALWENVVLDSGFKLAVVLTATQGAPNHRGRFYQRPVDPLEAEAVMGRPIGECLGPEWHLYIGGGLITARFAWSDTDADAIKEAFYTGTAFPDELLVNREHVDAVAKAAAARLYSSLLDRGEGGVTVPFMSGPGEPTGNLAGVAHMIASDGTAGTRLTMPPQLEPIDLEAYLPASVLNVVRRRVQP